MGDIFNDCQIIVTENKKSPDFHTLCLRLMTVVVTPISGKDKHFSE